MSNGIRKLFKTNGFSVQCWIAPQEYSWNWAGLVDQEKDHKEGFSFGINHVGHVGLCLAINGEWQSFLSKNPQPLHYRQMPSGPKGPGPFGALKGYSNFPNWNHWPVAQLPNDGRVAPVPDCPSSSCPGTLYPVRHKGEGIQEYVRDLYGMTDRDPKHLAALARSWNNPPVLELLGEAFANEGYDKNQRAYVLSHNGQGKPAELNFSIKASEESPVVNVPMVIKNWGGHEARLIFDGKPRIARSYTGSRGVRCFCWSWECSLGGADERIQTCLVMVMFFMRL